MKYFLSILSLAGLILFSACVNGTEDETTVLKGYIYSFEPNQSAQPVNNALVYAKNFYAQARTGIEGSYQISIQPEEDEFQVTLEASKAGYYLGQVSVLAKKGEIVSIPDITLEKMVSDTNAVPTDTVTTSGDAAHIELSGKHVDHIYIKSSGLKESALINFVVTDARGVRVDADHKETLNFRILNGPGGGEYLYPESMTTQGGSAYTVLSSGILAGPVQIEVTADVEGQTIRCIPVRLSIFGGLPDPDHFSVTADKGNIAGRVHFGILDPITAFVGDKFSNPVAPGTVVYFSSDYGIVDGSAVTDNLGRATVQFMSANPLPPDPATNPFAWITGTTYSDTLGQKKITSRTRLLLSDITAPIEVTPGSFTYGETNSAVNFNYHVSDIWGYPIVGESVIKVDATDGTLYGDTGIKLRDTQISGPGTTDFSFSWAPGDSLKAPKVYISISVDPPDNGNGYRSLSISGTKVTTTE